MTRRMLSHVIVALCACASGAQDAPPPDPAAPTPATVPTRQLCSDTDGHTLPVLDDAISRYGKTRALAQSADDKEVKLAIEQFQRLANDYPWLSLAQRGLGIAHGFRGNWIASYSAYVRYLDFAVHPADRERVGGELRILEQRQPVLRAFADAGRLVQDGQRSKATELLRKVIGQKPQFALAHRALGLLLAEQGKYGDAAEALDLYLKLEPFAGDRKRVEALLEQYRERVK